MFSQVVYEYFTGCPSDVSNLVFTLYILSCHSTFYIVSFTSFVEFTDHSYKQPSATQSHVLKLPACQNYIMMYLQLHEKIFV